MDRVAQRDFKFKDGLEIPKGTHTTINNQGINMDPSVYKDPEIFDGFRFSNLRDLPGNENKYQFPTTSEDSLAFGNGVHACPGTVSPSFILVTTNLTSRSVFCC